jgi:hypothetical protein
MKEQPSNLNRRDFIKKVGLATAAVLAGAGIETTGQMQEGNQTKIENEKLINELFNKREILPHQGREFMHRVDVWDKRYSGNDVGYDRLDLMYKKRHKLPQSTVHQELKEAWERLLAGDLETVYKITKEQNVPFDFIFLALAESHWKTKARSGAGAKGPWQFISSTARRYGLKINTQKKIDERLDVKKSTEAACKYLKDLEAKTHTFELSDSDRWVWAFLAYNRGEGYVFGNKNRKGDFQRAKGNLERYFSICRNRESCSYAPKIFGLAQALERMVMKKEEPAEKPPEETFSEADVMFSSFGEKSFPTVESRIVFLEKAILEYEEEGRKRVHTSEYIDAALDIIDKEMAEIRARGIFIPELQEPKHE